MVARTDLAWRILQITALALPAMGILLQVLVHLSQEKTDDTPHHYWVSLSMLVLIGPMVIVGIIAAGVITVSYEILWLQAAAILMGLSFLFVPLVLYPVYRGTRMRYKTVFLDREKEAIRKAATSGELSEDEAASKIKKVNVKQGGFLRRQRWCSEQLNRFFRRHPILFLGLHGGLLVWGIFVLLQGVRGFAITLATAWIILYSGLQISGHFVTFPSEESE